MQIFFPHCAVLCLYNIYFFITLLEAISETERCVCIVSSWSRHQSNSSSVSTAVRMEDSSEDISVVLFISLLCYNYILGWVLFGKSWSRSKVNSFYQRCLGFVNICYHSYINRFQHQFNAKFDLSSFVNGLCQKYTMVVK